VRTTGFAPAATTSTLPSAPPVTCATVTSLGPRNARYVLTVAYCYCWVLRVCLLSSPPCSLFVCIDLVVWLFAMQKPMQTPPHYTASRGYMGPGTPPSMYFEGGAPPYGSPIFNGPSIHRYGIPHPQFPGGSAYSYGYGGCMTMGSPYGPMHMTGPLPYTGGSLMGAGEIMIFLPYFLCVCCLD
jgi:hypothetical protein